MRTISSSINSLALKPLVFIRLRRILNLWTYKIQGTFKLTSLRLVSIIRMALGLVLNWPRSTSLSVGTHIEKKYGPGWGLRSSRLRGIILTASVALPRSEETNFRALRNSPVEWHFNFYIVCPSGISCGYDLYSMSSAQRNPFETSHYFLFHHVYTGVFIPNHHVDGSL